MFLSGHGVQAPGDAGYQFVTADARYADVMAGRYGDCLSLADLAFLADVPCRKLVDAQHLPRRRQSSRCSIAS